MQGNPLELLASTGPVEGGIAVVSLGAGAQGIIDLSMFADDPSGIQLGVLFDGANPLHYKFTRDPAATCNPAATSGVTRVANSTRPIFDTVPNGARYIAFTCVGATVVRAANMSGTRPLSPNNLQMMNIFVEGDSNLALDAPAADFAGKFGQIWYRLQFELLRLGIWAKFIANVAASGRQWNDPSGLAPVSAIANGPTLDAMTVTGVYSVLICGIGTNDVNSLGHNLATLQTNFNTYWDARIAAGVWDARVFLQPPPQTLNAGKDAILNSYWAYALTQVGSRLQAACGLPTTLQASVVSGVRNPRFVPNGSGSVAEHYNADGCAELAKYLAITLSTGLTVPAP